MCVCDQRSEVGVERNEDAVVGCGDVEDDGISAASRNWSRAAGSRSID
jgi:hypothetical protein